MRLANGLVAPRYDGGSIANLPATALRHLAGVDAGPALAEAALPREALRDVERIVLLVLDGLGWNQLERLRAEGAVPALGGLKAARITSIAPSTTAAALATLATGASPRAHAILGYRMLLPSFGMISNMIHLRGVVGGDLERAGLDVNTLLAQATIFERLAEAGVRAEAITRSSFIDTPLTRMIYRGAQPTGFVNVPDLFVAARAKLASMRGARGYLRLYYDGVDSVAHSFGPRSGEHDAETASIDAALGRELLRRVEDPQTLLLVTADHGHVTVPPDRVIRFQDHPRLLDQLVVPPSGEGRFAYLHVRPGRVDAARKYVEETWREEASILEVREAAEGGLFGPGPEHPEFARRAGDLLILAHENWRFHYEFGIHRPGGHVGNHGGLSADEMYVPLLYGRLG